MMFCLFPILKTEAICCSDMGRVRKNNEDNLYFFSFILPQSNQGLKEPISIGSHLLEVPEVYAVFDGMGGAADGEVASYLAAKTLKEECVKLGRVGAHISEAWLKSLTDRVNKQVQNAEREYNNGMGTTAAIMVLFDRKVQICSVGDSRIYRFRNNTLKQLSVDHTTAYYLNNGTSTWRKPVLTQYIGVPEDELSIQPFIRTYRIKKNDYYLVCSDGLTDMISDRSISSAFSLNDELQDISNALMKAAIEAGGRDNISFEIVHVL